MKIKKLDPALETAAELFLSAFNGEIPGHGLLERTVVGIPTSEQARWFRQTFAGSINFELFAGISSGVEEALPGELPVLVEGVFESLARTLATVAGSMVVCETLTEEAEVPVPESIGFELRRESMHSGRVLLAVPESALNLLRRVIHQPGSDMGAAPRHLDALMNVELPVTISFGTTEMMLADVLRLTAGSIVEFKHLLSDPVNIVVNDCLVARGDVVVVGSSYGVRISEVIVRA